MKAIIEFNLPEEQDEHKAAVDGLKWRSALFELDQQLRAIEKHGSGSLSATEYRDKIREIMYESGLMFDQLRPTWREQRRTNERRDE